jgi:hypothetical protein
MDSCFGSAFSPLLYHRLLGLWKTSINILEGVSGKVNVSALIMKILLTLRTP